MSTEQNKARVYKHLQLAAAPLAEPDRLTGYISIEQRKAAIYCDICTPPHRIAELVDAHADEIAVWLDAWGLTDDQSAGGDSGKEVTANEHRTGHRDGRTSTGQDPETDSR